MGPILEYMQPGSELKWSFLNGLLKMCRTNRLIIGPNCGLQMIQSAGSGTALRVVFPPSGAQLAVADGTITARGGTTLGSGNVFAVSISGTTATVGTVDIPVVSFSSTAGGIPTGTYVWIQQDPGGTWVVTAVDCG
jgi:hypothetical protein